MNLLDKALVLFPSAIRLYQVRSLANLRLNRFQEAIQDATKIIEINPNIPDGYYSQGFVLETVGEIESAIEAYNGGLRYDSKHDEILEALDRIERGQQGPETSSAQVRMQ